MCNEYFLLNFSQPSLCGMVDDDKEGDDGFGLVDGFDSLVRFGLCSGARSIYVPRQNDRQSWLTGSDVFLAG